jgi:hypothetical protein
MAEDWAREAQLSGRPAMIGWPSFLLAPPLGIGYLEHLLCWTRRQIFFCKYANIRPVGQGDVAGRPHLGSVSYPVSRKREQSLHTCAQDVQITHIVTI